MLSLTQTLATSYSCSLSKERSRWGCARSSVQVAVPGQWPAPGSGHAAPPAPRRGRGCSGPAARGRAAGGLQEGPGLWQVAMSSDTPLEHLCTPHAGPENSVLVPKAFLIFQGVCPPGLMFFYVVFVVRITQCVWASCVQHCPTGGSEGRFQTLKMKGMFFVCHKYFSFCVWLCSLSV